MSAIVALGSNLGDSANILREAMARLQAYSDEPLLKSSLWKTTPVAPRKEETPESLLQKLQSLERQLGRTTKKIHNEARALDLDLIAYGQAVRHTPELTLPHPRAHLRRFVLQPLNEIAPDLLLPGQAKPVSQLLAELARGERVARLDY